MDLTPLMNLLRVVPALQNRVAIATDLKSAVEAVKPFKATPVAILHGLKEAAGPNTRHSSQCPPLQPVTVTVSLLIVCRNVSDPYGAAASGDLDTARHAVIQALLGANPAPDAAPTQRYEPLEYQGGQLALADAGFLAWLDQFQTKYFLTLEAP